MNYLTTEDKTLIRYCIIRELNRAKRDKAIKVTRLDVIRLEDYIKKLTDLEEKIYGEN